MHVWGQNSTGQEGAVAIPYCSTSAFRTELKTGPDSERERPMRVTCESLTPPSDDLIQGGAPEHNAQWLPERPPTYQSDPLLRGPRYHPPQPGSASGSDSAGGEKQGGGKRPPVPQGTRILSTSAGSSLPASRYNNSPRAIR